MSGLTDRIQWLIFRTANAVVRGGRRLVGKGDMVRVWRRGLAWELDLTETIDFTIYLRGRFQRETADALVRLARDGDTVLDIGANVGAMALPAARAVGPGGRVICFEPTAFGARKLRRNVELNPEFQERVAVEQLELVGESGAEPGAVRFARWPVGPAEGRHAGHHGVAEGCMGAQAATPDDFCEEAGLTRVDLIKLDVDGNECGVLRGARRTLARFRPRMIVEIQPSAFDRPAPDRFEDMIALLVDAGYSLVHLDGERPLPSSAAELRRMLPGDSVLNAIALPGKPA